MSRFRKRPSIDALSRRASAAASSAKSGGRSSAMNVLMGSSLFHVERHLARGRGKDAVEQREIVASILRA